MIAHGVKQVELNALRPVNFGLILKMILPCLTTCAIQDSTINTIEEYE